MTISTWKSTSVGSCVHIRVVMFVGYAVPENVHSVRSSFSASLPIGCLAVDAGRVGIPNTTFIAKGLLPWLQPYTVLAGAYFIDDGNIEVAWWCLSIGTRQLWSQDKYNKKRWCPLEMMDITNPLTSWNVRDEENRSIRYLAKDCHLLLLLFASVVIQVSTRSSRRSMINEWCWRCW